MPRTALTPPARRLVLPPGETAVGGSVHELSAALRQRAYLLQWYALTMLQSDASDTVEPLLAGLWAPLEGVLVAKWGRGHGATRDGMVEMACAGTGRCQGRGKACNPVLGAQAATCWRRRRA